MSENHVLEQQQPYIEFRHVFKAFGDNQVLNDVSLPRLSRRDSMHPWTQRRR